MNNCDQCGKKYKPTRKYKIICKTCTIENNLIREINNNKGYLKFKESINKLAFKKYDK